MTSFLEKILKAWTGHGRSWWMDWVERRIEELGEPRPTSLLTGAPGEAVIQMKTGANWLADLAHEVQKLMIERGVFAGCGDGNVAQAYVVSLVLVLWTSRVCRSKTYNPKYLRKTRRKGAGAFHYHAAVFEAMVDESRDHLYFPRQEWDAPFAKEKK